MARPVKPLAVAQANHHMTKDEVRSRRAVEEALAVTLGRPEPPAWLEDFLVPAFFNLTDLLEARGLVTDADADAMASFVRSRYLEQMYGAKVIQLIGEDAPVSDIKQWQVLQDTATKQCRAYRASFGLTPKDRFNLMPATVTAPPEADPTDKFAAFVE